MQVLVTGGSGQLGSEWNRYLKKKDIGLHTFGSSELDITQKEAIHSTLSRIKPDVIINCAGYTSVDRAEEEKKRAEEINSTAVKTLAAICADQHIQLVHFSTDYVFSGSLEHKEEFPEGFPEEHPTDPINWYGQTKLMGEKAIQDSGVSHLIIRTSWLCGRYGSNFVTTMLDLATKKEEIDVVNDQWGSPSFTEHVVINTFNLIQRGQTGIFNITSEGLISWFDLAEAIFRQTNSRIKVNPVSSKKFNSRAERPRFSKLSTEKLKSVDGSEIWSWRKGLKRLLDQLEGQNR